MREHDRERGTAQWLRDEFGGNLDAFPIRLTGVEQTEIPWRDVQRRMITLLKNDRFFTDQELDNFDDVDPVEIRERLAEAGIVNGEVVDPDALDADPFIRQVMADAERIAQEEQAVEPSPPRAAPEPKKRPGQTRVERNYRAFTQMFPEIVSGEYRYLELRNREDGGLMPLIIQQIGENEIAMSHTYEQYGDLMYDPEMTFRIDTENGTLEPLTFRQDGGLPIYQEVYPEPGKWIPRLRNDLSAFTDQWLKNIEMQGRIRTRAIAEINGEDVEFTFDEHGNPVHSERTEQNIQEGQFTEITPTNTQAEPYTDSITLADGTTYAVGDMMTIHGTDFKITDIGPFDVQLLDPTLLYPVFRSESHESFERLMATEKAQAAPTVREETAAFYPGEKTNLPYDIEIRTLHIDEPEHTPPAPTAENFRILDTHLGEGGAKEKFWRNTKAIATLKQIENENRQATPEEQYILSQYVGWGGLPDAFDPDKSAWAAEYSELKDLLTDEEYAAARSSTLNAHYTTPTVIQAIYDAVGNMGFRTGNILEPAMGVGNFFGMLPEEMRGSRLYGVELDSISGRIAQQLYPQANITVAGFETTDRKDFFDLAVGNVPFGNYQVNDRAYNKLGFSIHNYFFAKALDQVRPGGIVAFVTSRYTMDAKDSTVRKYLAQRADLLGAIRLPNNAFKANAGTEVVADIIFLQKREQPILTDPEWVSVGQNQDGYPVNSYFLEHPEMVLGRQGSESTRYGQDYTVEPIESLELADQLADAIKYIHGTYTEAELPDLGENETIRDTIPADPDVKNYSYTVVDGEVYYRENSVMVHPELNTTAKERVKGMVALRTCVNELIDLQMGEYTSDAEIEEKQGELNRLYDSFTAKYGLINDRPNRLAFADDSSYYLLCSLEVLDEDRKLERKADFFSKRTIKQNRSVTHVDTSVEALTVSIGELARVDLVYMANLMGGQEKIPQIVADLKGIIFKEPSSGPFDYAESGENWSKGWQTADEYLSGNVRKKLREAKRAAERNPDFNINVEALEKAQPKDLDASEIEVRIGSTWVDKEVFQQFMYETFETPFYMKRNIQVEYSPLTAEWHITGKSSPNWADVMAYTTFGTGRANAYEIMEDTLNLRDVRIYDTVKDDEGKERRVLNSKETTLAAQKQQAIKDAFQDWVWKDPRRRETLVKQYNELMNSTRPREYDGSFLVFSGMNPEIQLREHQKNAIAHVIYGGNTMLAHEVGAGKTFEMVAAAMESKRLGLCSKSIFVVPNHLTEQWSAEFLRLYPSANILVTTRKDFEPKARKKFCSRIATGDYDAVIIGHS
ncbi:MAG: DEAD/DEAH box helicase family protein, partial [Clostridia bacterium]|nr:DEAD/DEAH box helicase family protein [Clostridia bacterium]